MRDTLPLAQLVRGIGLDAVDTFVVANKKLNEAHDGGRVVARECAVGGEKVVELYRDSLTRVFWMRRRPARQLVQVDHHLQSRLCTIRLDHETTLQRDRLEACVVTGPGRVDGLRAAVCVQPRLYLLQLEDLQRPVKVEAFAPTVG